MRYVPNLIPESSKVLPDYFKGNIYDFTKKNPTRETILWIVGLIFLLLAVVSIRHPLMTLIFGFIGLLFTPTGKRFIERKLNFRLTPKIKTITVLALFIGSLPLANHYSKIDNKIAYEQKLLHEKAAKEKLIADKKEQQRKDSLKFYINQSNQFTKAHKLDDANKQLQYALAFASFPTEKEQIERQKIGIATIKTIDLVKAGKYKSAIPEINNLLTRDSSNPELIYNRAVCYSKTGKMQEAVNDLKQLIQMGNSSAEKLHNKINPIRKRVSYYVTRCWDGSTSNAKGRGACSHHGGVKNWNEPIYEEYRKY